MKDKKTTVCETCPNTYNQMIKNIDLNSHDIPDDTWNKFFDKINELYKAKKEEMCENNRIHCKSFN